jgi:multisubunit Na+/H+ antiporter MnhC subunit
MSEEAFQKWVAGLAAFFVGAAIILFLVTCATEPTNTSAPALRTAPADTCQPMPQCVDPIPRAPR